MKAFIAAVILSSLAACSAVPKQEMQLVDASQCHAVEGAGIKQTRQGKPVYKYICNGKAVWAVQL